MADPGLLPVDVAGAGNVRRQRVGRLGLADAGRDVLRRRTNMQVQVAIKPLEKQ